jgi:MFS family permease
MRAPPEQAVDPLRRRAGVRGREHLPQQEGRLAQFGEVGGGYLDGLRFAGLLASLTIVGAAGGPLFGALLDRSRRPDRLLAWTLAAYALGIVAVQGAVGQLPMPGLAAIALLAGLFNPAVTGGWTARGDRA